MSRIRRKQRGLRGLLARFNAWRKQRADFARAKRLVSTWTRDPNLKFVLDLDAGTLCGIPIGSPLERFSFLGPCDAPYELGAVCLIEGELEDAEDWLHFNYENDGVSLSIANSSAIDYVSLSVHASDGESNIYQGRVVHDEDVLDLSHETSFQDAVRWFGSPTTKIDYRDLDWDAVQREMQQAMNEVEPIRRPDIGIVADWRLENCWIDLMFDVEDRLTAFSAHPASTWIQHETDRVAPTEE